MLVYHLRSHHILTSTRSVISADSWLTTFVQQRGIPVLHTSTKVVTFAELETTKRE